MAGAYENYFLQIKVRLKIMIEKSCIQNFDNNYMNDYACRKNLSTNN